MNILITGVCGYLGSALIHHWKEAGSKHTFYGIDNLSRHGSEANRLPLKQLGVKLIHGDLRLASDFEGLPSVDWVIEAAANPSVLAGIDGRASSRQLVEHNLQSTINTLEFCKRTHAGMILMSTSRVYSIKPLIHLSMRVVNDAFEPVDDGTEHTEGVSCLGVDETFSCAPPISLYGATKSAAETLALEYGSTFDFPVWINRCGVLAGAGQFGHAEQGIFSYWIHSWAQKRPLKYIGFGGDGYQVRDLLHPRDLRTALDYELCDNTFTGSRIVNLGGGQDNSMSLANLSTWCRERFGSLEVASEPQGRTFDVPWLVLNCARAKKLWNWTPQFTKNSTLEEIAQFAINNPDWLEKTAPN